MGILLSRKPVVFSVMGISQSHEQNKNRPVKVDGRTFGIMDNESALLE